MVNSNRKHDEYLTADVLSWYTDTPVNTWVEWLSELSDEHFVVYMDWAAEMQDDFSNTVRN